MSSKTTIGVQKETRQKIEKLKIHERETCDDVLTRVLNEFQKLKTPGKNKRLNI